MAQVEEPHSVLIVGSSGMLGRRLGDSLSSQGLAVVGISRSEIKAPPANWKSLVVPAGTAIPPDLRVDVVINCAGPSALWTQKNYEASLEFRHQHRDHLSHIMKLTSATKLINFSTFHVYASDPHGVISEEIAPTNEHPYAQNHVWMENVLKAEFPVVNFRLSNSFGFSQSRNSNYWSLLTHDVLRQLAISGSCSLRGNVNSIRDFVSLSDVVSAVLAMVESKAVGHFNLASGISRSVIEWTSELARWVNATGSIRVPDSYRDYEPSNKSFQIDISRLQESGWSPDLDFEDEVWQVFKVAGL